jgi:DNA repair exonuclease SbcCD ATPase subunit
MQYKILRLEGAILAAMTLAAGGAHAQSSVAEERLRDQLRQTTLQLRDAQDSIADLKAQLEKADNQLEAQHAAPAAAPPKPDTAENAALRTAVEERNQRIIDVQQRLEDSQKLLGQWQQAYQQAAALARARDADAKKFEARYAEASTRGETCARDNAELVNISRQLLDRYKKKGVWSALLDEEPVTQIHRIRLEALAQDYHADIEDHVAPPPPPDPVSTPTPPPQ